MEIGNAYQYLKASQLFLSLQKGDVVIYDSDVPRGFWKIARVTKPLTGKDEHSRGAILRVVARGQATTVQWSLQLLCPLEFHCGSSKNYDHIETEQNLLTNNTCEPKVQTENDEYPPLTSDLSLETDPDQPTTSNDDSVCRSQ